MRHLFSKKIAVIILVVMTVVLAWQYLAVTKLRRQNAQTRVAIAVLSASLNEDSSLLLENLNAPSTELGGNISPQGLPDGVKASHGAGLLDAILNSLAGHPNALVEQPGSVALSAEGFQLALDALKGLSDAQLGSISAYFLALTEADGGEVPGHLVIGAWAAKLYADRSPDKALSVSASIPVQATDDASEFRRAALRSLAARDPDAAMNWILSRDLDPEAAAEFTVTAIAGMSKTRFSSAVEVVNTLSGKVRREALEVMLSSARTARQREMMVEAIAQEADVPWRDHALGELATSHGSFQDEAAFFETQIPAEMRTAGLAVAIAAGNLSDQPEKKIRWLLEQSPPSSIGANASRFIEMWAREDFNAAGKYIGELQQTPWRGDVVSAFAKRVAVIDPVAAEAWASTIREASLREQTLRSIRQ